MYDYAYKHVQKCMPSKYETLFEFKYHFHHSVVKTCLHLKLQLFATYKQERMWFVWIHFKHTHTHTTASDFSLWWHRPFLGVGEPKTAAAKPCRASSSPTWAETVDSSSRPRRDVAHFFTEEIKKAWLVRPELRAAK